MEMVFFLIQLLFILFYSFFFFQFPVKILMDSSHVYSQISFRVT